jgi:ribonuclease R
MARQPRKSSTRFNRDQRERTDFPRESARSELKRSFAAPPTPERILSVLADQPTGATALQLAQAMRLEDGSRTLGLMLRRLVEQGQVLERRPGRYQVSGAGGEHAAVLSAGADGEALTARLGDGRELAVAPNYRLGARAGDVVQVAIGEDGLALVTRINRRSGREVVGTILFRPGGPLLVPDNRKEGQLPVLSAFPRFHDQYRAGDRVVGAISVDAEGKAGVHLERILGPETPEVADFRYVCLTHDLPGAFPAEVEEQAAAYRERLTLNSTKGSKREDLREQLVFTIDPATAKDFDDAISLSPSQNGGWILGVHIADVSHYVTEHSPLDAEAAARGTSIYLINRVIPMLPETLSNGLCSLVPSQERYCLSAFLTLDRAGNLTHTRLAETLIKSRHRLTYEEALAVLERRDEPGKWPQDLKSTLIQVGEIAQTLRRARDKAGALNLHSVEHRFALDVDGQPVAIGQEGSDISHQLIEECMLLANRAVARWLEDQGLPCIYRIHQEPDPEKMKQFGTLLESYGKDSRRITERFGLQKLLAELGKEPPAARIVLNYLCLRSFKKAVYAVDNIGHYALAFASYAHFTSPIRRYPDLLVHRLVKRGLGLMGYRAVEIRYGYLDALAKQASWLEQRAEAAERDLGARKSARYLATRLGETFAGVVVTATPGGLVVQLLETGQEAFLPMRELEDDFYTYDQERMALIGRHSGRVLGVATELDVLVSAVDIERADVVLGLAPGGARGAGTIDRDPKASAERKGRVQRRRDHEAARGDQRRRERRGKRGR